MRKSHAHRPAPPAEAELFDDFLPYLVARLAHLLHLDLVEKLRHEGINSTRWRILAVLAMEEGLTVNAIAERAMTQQSALSRALMTMEKERYVRRTSSPGDARYVQVFLTAKGRQLFHALNVVVRARESRLLEGLSAGERQSARRLMRRLLRNVAGGGVT
ncbi:MAG TPA: MarR family transcriptional regulator [Steroidobacteraceae bacterium]|nr:MarR family transcriptional regulator [Steroidobacteraceae bacterium]